MRISDWSSDVCSSDLRQGAAMKGFAEVAQADDRHGAVAGGPVVGTVGRVGALLHQVHGAVPSFRYSRGGPNPNWTEMQKYEWYVGYLANFSAPPAQGSRTTSPRWRPKRRRSRSTSSSPTTAATMAAPARTSATGSSMPAATSRKSGV